MKKCTTDQESKTVDALLIKAQNQKLNKNLSTIQSPSIELKMSPP